MLETSSGDRSASPGHAPGGQQVSSRQGQRPRSWAWVYVLAFLLTGAILAFNILRPITVLPRITPAPGYALQDPTGAIVNSEAQRGKLTLYSFTYSECADPCVQSAADIAATRGALATALPSDVTVDFLTISVDPEFDTPQRLAELQAANAGPEADGVPWTFLTSDPLRTRMAVGKGFGVYFAEPKVEPDATRSVTFDPRYVLVDGWGIIRAEYRAARPDPEILERDVNLLVSEARNSSGLVKLGYEAAHLFACYPR